MVKVQSEKVMEILKPKAVTDVTHRSVTEEIEKARSTLSRRAFTQWSEREFKCHSILKGESKKRLRETERR